VDDDARVLLISGQAELVEAVRAAAAAAGVPVVVRSNVDTAGPLWLTAPLVLLGDDATGRGVPVRRPAVVLVCPAGVQDGVFRVALRVGAEQCLRLPDERDALLDRLVVVADPGAGPGRVLAVVGGRGGAGATTLAACLAATAARDRSTMLVDLDPMGSGVDAVLGCEGAEGLRWPDLDGVRGPVRGSVLRQGLPSVDGVGVLSWGRGPALEPRPAAVESVLDAARRHCDLVVVDLPRSPGPAAFAALTRTDAVVMLVPAEVRATLAAARVLAQVHPLVPDVRLVVRGPAPGGLVPEQVGQVLGLAVGAALRPEPGLAAALERGDMPSPRGPLRRWCRGLLTRLDEPVARSA
jgi:secretion/DNA translocation related CpaE-like protein